MVKAERSLTGRTSRHGGFLLVERDLLNREDDSQAIKCKR